MIDSHLPWWLGAGALATAAILHWKSTGALLGVSGLFASLIGTGGQSAEADTCAPASAGCGAPDVASGPPWTARLTFVLMLAVGGLAGRLLMSGEWRPTLELGAEYARVFGAGASGYVALLAGGLLVGAGTRLAGGCTSGHGLNGCARLQRPSLLNTALFLGTAVVLSLALGRLA